MRQTTFVPPYYRRGTLRSKMPHRGWRVLYLQISLWALLQSFMDNLGCWRCRCVSVLPQDNLCSSLYNHCCHCWHYFCRYALVSIEHLDPHICRLDIVGHVLVFVCSAFAPASKTHEDFLLSHGAGFCCHRLTRHSKAGNSTIMKSTRQH